MSITDTTLAETEILLAQPRGFCAGVDRAIEIVERAIKLHGSPIYVRHEIVHNAYVVEDLRKKGAIFIAPFHLYADDRWPPPFICLCRYQFTLTPSAEFITRDRLQGLTT